MKKLEKFQEGNKRKNQIILFTILCVFLIAGVFLYQSFALFETNEQFNIVTGTIENPGDITFAFYINDEIVLEAPKSDSGLALDEKSSCTNDVSVSWNVETWNANLDYSNYKQENTSKVKCNLYFRNSEFSDYVTSCGQNNTSAAECMKKYSDKDTVNLAYDDTTDNNLRYIGSAPNNYVFFNNELWRIIGVMENVDNGTGKKESRIKLIRDEPIGSYSWDSVEGSINNGGCGINEWSQADLMKLMNPGYETETIGGSLYWNGLTGYCYIGHTNQNGSCSFNDIGLKNSQDMIENVLWHLGSNGNINESDNQLNTIKFYEIEKSDNSGKICSLSSICNDEVKRTIKWTGLVALIYPSDYGFATSGGKSTSREQCLNNALYQWNNYEDCYQNNWLYKINMSQWLLTPTAIEDIAYSAWAISPAGLVVSHAVGASRSIFPSIFLKSMISIIDGTGTKEAPYILKLQ